MFTLHLDPATDTYRTESSFDEFQNFGLDADAEELFLDVLDAETVEELEEIT